MLKAAEAAAITAAAAAAAAQHQLNRSTSSNGVHCLSTAKECEAYVGVARHNVGCCGFDIKLLRTGKDDLDSPSYSEQVFCSNSVVT